MEEKPRFPSPWFVHRSSDRTFQVLDAKGLVLAHVDFQSPDLTEEEARALAKNIARLPELLRTKKDDRRCLLDPVVQRMIE
jgi:hypothetical protein